MHKPLVLFLIPYCLSNFSHMLIHNFFCCHYQLISCSHQQVHFIQQAGGIPSLSTYHLVAVFSTMFSPSLPLLLLLCALTTSHYHQFFADSSVHQFINLISLISLNRSHQPPSPPPVSGLHEGIYYAAAQG